MANRAQYGINTLWINLLCEYVDGCNKDATTFDGIPPFTVVGDLSTTNPAYFQRADDMINIAAALERQYQAYAAELRGRHPYF